MFLKHPLCNWTTGIALMESRGQERYFFSSELQRPQCPPMDFDLIASKASCVPYESQHFWEADSSEAAKQRQDAI